MFTKITQKTKCVYILNTEIVKIKILCDNEGTENIHQNSYIYTKNVQTVKKLVHSSKK